MRTIARRERLIENLVKLRRAERVSVPSEEIASVRADLEEMVGPTVTRALAARMLGVSQTALERWVGTGDVPVLITPTGRHETPLHALVQLIDAVREHRAEHPEDPRPLGSVLHTRRVNAEQMDASTPAGHSPPNVAARPGQGRHDRHDGNGHDVAERRGLAYHRAVARRLDEQIVRDARNRLARWRSQNRIDPHYARQWEEILAAAPTRMAQMIGEDTPQMRDLRQNSPFAGALNEPERRHVLARTG
jgi:hypothetical protein